MMFLKVLLIVLKAYLNMLLHLYFWQYSMLDARFFLTINNKCRQKYEINRFGQDVYIKQAELTNTIKRLIDVFCMFYRMKIWRCYRWVTHLTVRTRSPASLCQILLSTPYSSTERVAQSRYHFLHYSSCMHVLPRKFSYYAYTWCNYRYLQHSYLHSKTLYINYVPFCQHTT